MAKQDLSNFSMPVRIVMGIIAIAMIVWMLKWSGTI
jgi:hypothetical protein